MFWWEMPVVTPVFKGVLKFCAVHFFQFSLLFLKVTTATIKMLLPNSNWTLNTKKRLTEEKKKSFTDSTSSPFSLSLFPLTLLFCSPSLPPFFLSLKLWEWWLCDPAFCLWRIFCLVDGEQNHKNHYRFYHLWLRERFVKVKTHVLTFRFTCVIHTHWRWRSAWLCTDSMFHLIKTGFLFNKIICYPLTSLKLAKNKP